MQRRLLPGLLVLLTVAASMPAFGAWPPNGSRIGVKRISASPDGDHTCIVLAFGVPQCWGNNASGQIGDGTSGNVRRGPAVVSGITSAIGVAAGRDHSCALLVNGTVKCWGSNAEGQLGVGQGTPSSAVPVQVPGLSNVVALAAGTRHTCARISNGGVMCWGNNASGQLGAGSNATRSFSPLAVSLADAVTLTAGRDHTCVVRAGGIISCWGDNGQGQLGVGGFNQNRNAPVNVATAEIFTDVSAGAQFTCGRRGNGGVLCWGDNDFGQFGNGTATNRSEVPVLVALVLTDGGTNAAPAVTLATGATHACVATFGEFGPAGRCWGANASGQLGFNQISAFESLPRRTTTAVEMAAGRAHTCALLAADEVTCWGENGSGQLGSGTASSSVPVPIPGLGGSVSALGISAGANHTCAWRASGDGACWGRGDEFQLGNANSTDRLVPTRVNVNEDILAMSVGGGHSCAMFEGEAIPRCWGDNRSHQSNAGIADPFVILSSGLLPGAFGLIFPMGSASGPVHSCMVIANGKLSCQGSNASGQLGIGADTLSNVPDFHFPVAGFTDAVAVAVGDAHSCALRASGRVFCWGLNTFGQMGDDSLNSGPTAREAVALTNAVAITAGRDHTCALLANGQVACWGRNSSGQVDGTTAQRLKPTLVPGIAVGEAVAVTAGAEHTCVLRATGAIRCWGRNDRGQLGNNTTSDSLSPVFVLRGTIFLMLNGASIPVRFEPIDAMVSVDAGNGHNCAVRVSGQPFCWGRNPEGQLGDNSQSDRPIATGVGSFVANIDPEATLSDRHHRAVTVTALVNCPEGARFDVEITVTQGAARATQGATDACTGGLAEFPVRIPAGGKSRLQVGAATASADVVVRSGHRIIDVQHWSRAVQISAAP